MKLHGTTIVLGAVVLLLLILLGLGCSMSCGNKEGLLVDGVEVGNFVIDGVPVNNALVDAIAIDPNYSASQGCYNLYDCNPEPSYQGRLAWSLYDDCQC